MRRVELFRKDNVNINRLLEGKVINKIEYSDNIPLEDNCIKIIFTDNSYFLIYALMRIVYKGQIALSSGDYYFDKNFVECISTQPIESTLMYHALIKVNNLLKNGVIEKATINSYGDLIINIDSKVRIEIFFDVSEDDKDYYSYFGNDGTYFSLYRIDNQLLVIEAENDKD